MDNEIIHVGIAEPKEKRKEILSITIDTIQLLKKYERYKKIQKEKNLYRTNLTKNIKQLNTMLKGFEKMIPEVQEQSKPIEQPKITKQTIAKKKAVKIPIKKKKEFSKLESDIVSLKSKINEL